MTLYLVLDARNNVRGRVVLRNTPHLKMRLPRGLIVCRRESQGKRAELADGRFDLHTTSHHTACPTRR